MIDQSDMDQNWTSPLPHPVHPTCLGRDSGMDPLLSQSKRDDEHLFHLYLTQEDETAFRNLFEKHWHRVFSTCYGILQNVHSSQDAAQKVFLLLAEKGSRLPPHVVLSGWLYRTAIYTAKNYHRKHLRNERFLNSLNETDFCVDPWNESRDMKWKSLQQALESLPLKTREVLSLHFFEGMSQRETAETLGCEEGTVRKRIFRGVSRLKIYFKRREKSLTAAALVWVFGSIKTRAAEFAPFQSPVTHPLGRNGGFLSKLYSKLKSLSLIHWGLGGLAAALVICFIGKNSPVPSFQEENQSKWNHPPKESASHSSSRRAVLPKSFTRQEIAAFDLESSIRNAMQTSEPTRRQERFRQIASHISSESFLTAFDFARKYSPNTTFHEGDEVCEFIHVLMTSWAQKDSEAVSLLVEGLPSGQIRSEASVALIEEWSKQSPSNAAEWINHQMNFISEKQGSILMSSLFRSLAEVNPRQARLWAEALPEPADRVTAFAAIGQVLSQKNMPEAIQWLQGLKGHADDYRSFFNSILFSMGRNDPYGALHLLSSTIDVKDRSLAYGHIVQGWTEKDPRSALNWLVQHSVSTISFQNISEKDFAVMARALIRVDPVLSLNWIRGLTGESRAAGFRLAANEGMANQPSETMSWIQGLADEDRLVAYSGAAESLVKKDPIHAIAIASSIQDADQRNRLEEEVVYRWANRAPNEALKWVVNQPAGEERSTLFFNGMYGWAQRDPKAAFSWAKQSLTGDDYAFALMRIASALAYSSASEAKAIAVMIPQGNRRTEAMANIAFFQTGFLPTGTLTPAL